MLKIEHSGQDGPNLLLLELDYPQSLTQGLRATGYLHHMQGDCSYPLVGEKAAARRGLLSSLLVAIDTC